LLVLDRDDDIRGILFIESLVGACCGIEGDQNVLGIVGDVVVFGCDGNLLNDVPVRGSKGERGGATVISAAAIEFRVMLIATSARGCLASFTVNFFERSAPPISLTVSDVG
jgi:hypothetical protein